MQALAREFARQEIEPHAAGWDRDHRFPRELFAKLAELGLMGACIPEEYGGAGADFLSYVLVLEELSRADAGVVGSVLVFLMPGSPAAVRLGMQRLIGPELAHAVGQLRRTPRAEGGHHGHRHR